MDFKLFKSRKNSSTDIEKQIEKASDLDIEDKEMLKSVFSFGEMIAREVMVPRTDMVTLEEKDTLDDAMKLFIRSGFSRIPILGHDADEVVGIAYFKDVVERTYLNNKTKKQLITSVARPAQFVPEMKPVDDLFRMMQQERQHIALIVDEYGGIAGLATIEDCLEEIVGNLDDEHDITNNDDDIQTECDESGNIVSAIVSSRYAISDLEDLFSIKIEHDEVDTVLGLLTREIGRVAIRGSQCQIEGIIIEAVSISGRRKQVSKLHISRIKSDIS